MSTIKHLVSALVAAIFFGMLMGTTPSFQLTPEFPTKEIVMDYLIELGGDRDIVQSKPSGRPFIIMGVYPPDKIVVTSGSSAPTDELRRNGETLFNYTEGDQIQIAFLRGSDIPGFVDAPNSFVTPPALSPVTITPMQDPQARDAVVSFTWVPDAYGNMQVFEQWLCSGEQGLFLENWYTSVAPGSFQIDFAARFAELVASRGMIDCSEVRVDMVGKIDFGSNGIDPAFAGGSIKLISRRTFHFTIAP